MSEPPQDETALRAAAGIFTGFALLAMVDAGAIALGVPFPVGGASLRASHHLFDAAETLGVGALAALVAGAFLRFVRLPTWAVMAVYALVAAPVVYVAMGDNLLREAALLLDSRRDDLLFVPLLVATSGLVPTAHLIGAFVSRGARLRSVGVAVGLAGMIVPHLLLADDYFGIHAVVSWAAATFAGASLAPLAARAWGALRAGPRGRVVLAALAAVGAFGILVPPPNATRLELFRQPCAIAPWVLATTLWRPPPTRAPAPASRWLAPRADAPPVPPTAPALLPDDPVVVLITVDALRGDAALDPANAALLPTLAEIRRRGATFTHASSAASQTALSLGTVFSGRYFSELLWKRYGVGAHRFNYLSEDEGPRVPAILSDRGVATVDVHGVAFLAADFGVARGFHEETVLDEGDRKIPAQEIVDPVLARLRRARRAPLFVYAHLMETHAPYAGGREGASAKERYLDGAAAADAQIARVLRLLERRFADRWALLVAADHGEAFGDHGTFQHSKTLYEELLHVPLLAVGPRIAPRVVEQRVGLVDLGPTILDLFGAATPAVFEGQSLVPLLAGRDATLDRPLLAESRLRRAITTPDGLKVIEDLRRKTVEVYDLAGDPGEAQNLFDADPAGARAALATLRAFFGVHTLRRPGYRPPYEP